MASWHVHPSNGAPYPVEGLGELKERARSGALSASDMIQPPGTNEWLYASEIPELSSDLEAGSMAGGGGYDLDDDLSYRSGMSPAAQGLLALILLAVIGIAGFQMYEYSTNLPDGTEELSLSYSEMVVTKDGVSLRSEADPAAPVLQPLPRNTVLELLSKRGGFYRARLKEGGQSEGWVAASDVIPIYLLGGGEVREEFDPLYNPDRYVTVLNASWMQLPEQRADQITIFQFMLRNASRYDMTDLVMVAKISDAKGHELETVEFQVTGVVPAQGTTMVGTLTDPEDEDSRTLVTEATFKAEAESNPELNLNYNDGVEVRMSTDEFTEATVDIVELRAIPATDD